MKPIRFNSVLNPSKWGYEFTNDTMTFWDTSYRHGGVLHCSMGYFETYGDGNVQHGPLMACGVEHMADYLVSLVRYLLANPEEEIQTYGLEFTPCNVETVKWLATIQFKEGRRQWFNVAEQKVSSSEAKQHDKRWTEVPTWANADMVSAVGLFTIGKTLHRDLFTLYALHEYFWDTLYTGIHGDWAKLTEYQERIPGDHKAAFRAFQLLIQARTCLESARRVCDCAQGNMERAAEMKEVAA